MKIIFSVFLICTVLLLGGCSSSEKESSKSLKGSEWTMFEMNGNKFEPPVGKSVSLNFENSTMRISGKAPCNTYSSGYIKADNKLSFSQMISTDMACDEMELEYIFMRLLPKTFAYQISGDKLYLFDSEGMVIFRFKAK